MKRLLCFGIIILSAALAGCGGSGNTITGQAGGGGAGATAASVQVTASSTSLNSSVDATTSVQIFALVQDAGNVAQANVPVGWSATSGNFSSIESVTNTNGMATAVLTNGLNNPGNRAITVTVTAGGITQTIVINVVGTTLNISGPPALALGDAASFSVVLQDSLGNGIDSTVSVASGNGNSVSPGTVATVGGSAQVDVTAVNSGVDTITASALGLTATAPLTVSDDVFAILTPTAGQELALGVPHNVTVQWTKAGVPQVGQTISFTFDRGTLSSATAVTDGAGQATVTITSNSAGQGNASATNPDGTSTSVSVEFVATDAAALDLQASPLAVAIGDQSTLTATVRDLNNNLVKNKLVVFVLEQDSTNGFLTIGSALTDSSGRAVSAYSAGLVPSASGGVVVRAFVQESPPLVPAVEDTVALTVTGRAIDMSIGTGDTLNSLTPSLYSKEWAIIVTDTTGTATPVANETVQATIRSVRFHKGQMALFTDAGGNLFWAPASSLGPPAVQGYAATCVDEDTNQDGFLAPGLPPGGEDVDNDGVLDAGNRATLAALAPGAADDACATLGGLGGTTAQVQTDANGIARICVIYPKSDNLWVDVKLSALLNVFGTEYSESQEFTLEALAADLNDENSSPAGQFSPFGQAPDCANPL